MLDAQPKRTKAGAKARGWPVLGVLPSLLRDVIGTFRSIRSRYGDLVEFDLPADTGYLVSDPEFVRQVLIAGEPAYSKGKYTARMQAAFGGGLVTAEGSQWKRQRKLLQPLFSNDSLRKWHPIVQESVDEMLASWTDAAHARVHVDAADSSRALLQRIMGRIMFGNELAPDRAQAAARAMTEVNDTLLEEFLRTTILSGAAHRLPTPGSLRFRRALREFDAIVDEALRNETQAEGDHLIAQFRRARYADECTAMTPKQFRDEVATFFFAGQETTANALAWSFFFIAQHSQIAKRVAQEAAFLVDGKLEFDDLEELIFTRQVVNEALRLRPPAYAIEREVKDEGVQLDGCPLKKGALVVLAPSVTHVHPEHWDSPDRFDPDRFSAERSRGRHAYAFFPFGGGARKCIGINLSLMELTTAVAMATQKFTIELDPGAQVRAKPALTLRPSPGVPLVLQLRQPTKPAEGLRP